MPKIPEFQRRQLASSLTGANRRDRSGELLGNAVANASNKVQNTSFQIFQDRKRAKDEALANKESISLDFELEKTLRDHQTEFAEFRGEPEERVKAYEEKARQILTAKVGAVPSRAARDAVSLQAERILAGKLSKEFDTANKNMGVLAYNDVIDSANTLSLSAAEIGRDQSLNSTDKLKRVRELLGQHYQHVDGVLGKVIDPEKLKGLRTELPKSIVRGFVTTATDIEPEEVLALIGSGKLNEFGFDGEEIQTMRSNARNNLAKVRERIEFETLATEIELNGGEFWDAYKNKDPMLLAKLETAEQTPFVQKMKKLVYEATDDAQVKADVYLGLQAKFDKITGGSALTPRDRAKKTDKATLREIAGFMNDVIDARNEGHIKDGDVETYFKQLALPWAKKVEQAKGAVGFLGSDSPEKAGIRAIDGWFKKAGRDVDIEDKAELIREFFSDLRANPTDRLPEAEALATAVIVKKLRQENPVLATVEGTPEEILKLDGELRAGIPGDKNLKTGGKTARRTVLLKDPVSGLTAVAEAGPDGKPIRGTERLINAAS